MKSIKKLLLLMTMVCCSVAYAQTNNETHISGHVLDKETGEHVPYVTIAILDTKYGAVADETGHYFISSKTIPDGEYKIEASFMGYKTEVKTVKIYKNKSVEVNFDLETKPLEVGDVVVSSTRNVTKRKESPSVVGVLTSKQFELTASCNVSEVLNFQPGLRVEYNCGNCGVPQLRINGLGGQYSQILLDSKPIFSSLAGVYGLEQMPSSMIERVEVLRGGGSALFGSNAIGGVVNIITKEPKVNSLAVGTTIGVTDNGRKDINSSFNGSFVSKDGKAGMYLFGMVRDRDDYDHNSDGFSEVPKLESETIGFRGYYKTSRQGRLTAEYHHISEYRRGGDSIDSPPHEANLAEELHHKIDGGGIKYDHFSNDLRTRFNIYSSMQNISRKSYFGTDMNLDAYGMTKDLTYILGGQFSHNFNQLLFMPSELTLGFEYNNNDLEDVMLGYNRLIEQKSYVYGGFIQNEWKNEKFSALFGVRVDKHNKIKDIIASPRVNIRYTPVQNVIIRGSYSSGYRAPQAYDEDLHVAAVGGDISLIVLSEDLRPEYSNSFSASVDYYANLGNWNLNLLLEGFYTNIDDVFALEDKGKDANNNQILERTNVAGAKIAGLNAELKLGYGDFFNFQAGYTHQKSRYKEDWSWSENVAPQRKMLRAPDNYGFVTLEYNPIKKLSISATGNYTGSMLVPHFSGYIENDEEIMSQEFFDMGVKAAYNFKLSRKIDLEFSFGVKNVTNTYQKDLDVGALKDSKFIYGPNTPRTYMFGIKFTM